MSAQLVSHNRQACAKYSGPAWSARRHAEQGAYVPLISAGLVGCLIQRCCARALERPGQTGGRARSLGVFNEFAFVKSAHQQAQSCEPFELVR
jgi:hypothetical protein